MKRWPLIASFVLFIALCATLAYWAMQFFKPPVRPVAAPPPSVQAPPNIDAAASLFGGKGSTAVASNFQLKGVIMAGDPADSVVILAADGKPAQAIRVNREIAPGVKVKEVNRGYVVLLDNGVEKRVELPEDSKLASGITSASTAPVAATPMPARPAPAMPATVVNGTANSAPPNSSPGTSEPESNGSGNADPNADQAPAPAPQASPAGASAGSSSPAAAAQASGRTAPASSATPPPSPTPAPGTGMGSPPITGQGSLAGSANPPATATAPSVPPAPAARAVPGMPVTPQQPPRP